MSHEHVSPAPIESVVPDVLAQAQNEFGHMSLRALDKRLTMYARDPACAEVTIENIEDTPQALIAVQGLLNKLEKEARARGIHKLIATSGPNGNTTGIEFWNRVYGPPVATAEDYDGPHLDRYIWPRTLRDD